MARGVGDDGLFKAAEEMINSANEEKDKGENNYFPLFICMSKMDMCTCLAEKSHELHM